ncbi:MAG: TadE/TadG family type IV pilus assembly protein [Acetobacteraceae bacterium]|jgi:Flp pilus assembly protein TadG
MSLWRRSSDRRGVATLEFAFAAGPFLVATFFTIALSLHLFKQEALDTALHVAVRQIQTGNAQNVTNGSTFVTNYLCPNLIGVIACGSVSVNIQKLTFSAGQDYYNFTTGGLPMSGGSLDMSSYASSKFCNSSPSQFILVTAVYTSPNILGSLLPNVFSVSYNGGQVDALMSQVAAVTENYSVQPPSGNTTPAPSC